MVITNTTCSTCAPIPSETTIPTQTEPVPTEAATTPDPAPAAEVEISEEGRKAGKGSAVSQAVHAAKAAYVRGDGTKLGPLVSAAARQANGSLPVEPPEPNPTEETSSDTDTDVITPPATDPIADPVTGTTAAEEPTVTDVTPEATPAMTESSMSTSAPTLTINWSLSLSGLSLSSVSGAQLNVQA